MRRVEGGGAVLRSFPPIAATGPQRRPEPENIMVSLAPECEALLPREPQGGHPTASYLHFSSVTAMLAALSSRRACTPDQVSLVVLGALDPAGRSRAPLVTRLRGGLLADRAIIWVPRHAHASGFLPSVIRAGADALLLDGIDPLPHALNALIEDTRRQFIPGGRALFSAVEDLVPPQVRDACVAAIGLAREGDAVEGLQSPVAPRIGPSCAHSEGI